ncbi:2-oxo acid dehydrogenase subunit E2 [Micromonospora zhanjiangensis]
MGDSAEELERHISALRAAVRDAVLAGDRARSDRLRDELRAVERGWDEAVAALEVTTFRGSSRLVPAQRRPGRPPGPRLSIREQVHHALTLLSVPAAPKLIIEVHAAFLGAGEIVNARLTHQRRDEERSFRTAPYTRPYYLCSALNLDLLGPVRGLLAVSTWPLERRIIGPLSPRVDFLTAAIQVAGQVDRLRSRPDWREVRVSPLLLVAKAVLLAVRRHPMVNSTWAGDEIVVKDYVNLGIAAATERGLIVPNIKDAGRLTLRELADAMTALVQTAKAGRTAPAEMSGGTLTITNVGVFGVDTGTPILPPGESAILAFGAVREMPWVHKGKIKVRQVTTLGLSFDHRIIDGELGSKFLRDVGAFLADPEATMLAWT